MNLNDFLIWIVAFWCVFLLISLLRVPFNQIRGWLFVTIFILAVMAGIFYFAPEWTGFVGGSLWLIFVLLPLNGMRKANQLISAGRYAEARKLMAKLRWLHPADGWREQPALLRALEIGQRGDMAEALAILKRYQNNATSIGRNATVILYKMGARWEELLFWVRKDLSEKILFEDLGVSSYYLRALGETGDLNRLLQEFDRLERNLEKRGDPATVNTVRMFILAFCGQTEELQKSVSISLAMLPKNMRQFWLATAEMAAGNEEVARQQLLALHDEGDMGFRNAIALRLSQSRIDIQQVLTESSKQILSRVAIELKHEGKYGRAVLNDKKAYATYALILINLAVFCFTMYSLINSLGTEGFEGVLYRLGALEPGAFWAGEWWRALNATFLHAGFLHLGMNMMALYALGSFVERSLGIWRYLISYFTSGIGSMLVIAIIARYVPSQAQITVGASGAIMGLIGVMGAIMLSGWLREKSRVAAKNLKSILFIVVLQFLFDITHPQISIIGHNAGLIIGFLTGNLLVINWGKKK
ncbi:rhomboid family intramembrane serine protease [Aerosakkonema sp. BLCC-F183]|uniref:rhomboid family intramembrane serine protease n=1 Tax=Aerosakkonema sp. BLCC-F183 TaxID=3342834 RepID=UPI0035BAF59B